MITELKYSNTNTYLIKGNDGYINLKKLFAISGYFDGASFGAKRNEWLDTNDRSFLDKFTKNDLDMQYKNYNFPYSLELFNSFSSRVYNNLSKSSSTVG